MPLGATRFGVALGLSGRDQSMADPAMKGATHGDLFVPVEAIALAFTPPWEP